MHFSGCYYPVNLSLACKVCRSASANWELLKAGAGIGFTAAFLTRQATGVVRILPEVDIPPLPMWLTAYQELRTSLRIRRVMDFLSAALQALELGYDKLGSILDNPE